MRLHPALALLAMLLPIVAGAQTDEWLRDDMSDDALHLLRTSNLSVENASAAQLPGSIGGSTQWIVSKGDGPAYVVYFVPGRIHEVEIDTHRLTGASGEFNIAVSSDGRLYQPLDTGSMLLDSAFGWDYRLVATDQVPENATHLLVQFPDAASAHRLSEVWIRFSWDDALAAPFLPPPAPVSPPAASEFAAQSDAELEKMIAALSFARPPVPVPEIPRQADVDPTPIAITVPFENRAPDQPPTLVGIEPPVPTDSPLVTVQLPEVEETESGEAATRTSAIRIDIEVPDDQPATEVQPGDEEPTRLITLQAEKPETTKPDAPEDAGGPIDPSELPAVEARIEPSPSDAVNLQAPETPRIEIRLEPSETIAETEGAPQPIVLPPFFLAVPAGPAATNGVAADSAAIPSKASHSPDPAAVSGTPFALTVVDASGPVTVIPTAEPAQPVEEIRHHEADGTGFLSRPKRIGPRSKFR